MVDKISRQARSANMRAIRSKGTKPEMTVRRMIHKMGYRYRLHRRELPGRPDLVFPARRKVIFINGCFWHQHPAAECKIRRTPKSNLDYWEAKLEGNVVRDRENWSALEKAGWKVLVIWECELKEDAKLGGRIRRFLA